MLNDHILSSFQEAESYLSLFVSDTSNISKITEVSELIARCFQNKGKVLICGNGGSACDAAHFAEEFTGRYRKDRKALPVIAINNPSHITCVANDYGFEYIFSRYVEAFANENDIVIGLSTSGNSANVFNALQSAKKQGAKTVALLGKDGGKILGKSNYEWIIPAKNSDRIQEIHMLILHSIIEAVERILFPENYIEN